MKAVVIDASVILGYLLNSNATAYKEFPRLLKKAKTRQLKIFSTSFLPLEIANGLRFSLKNNNDASVVLDKFTRLPLKLINLSNELVMKAIDYAYANKTSVYDASYHLLAISRNLDFLTCDKQYYQAAKKLSHIKLLG